MCRNANIGVSIDTQDTWPKCVATTSIVKTTVRLQWDYSRSNLGVTVNSSTARSCSEQHYCKELQSTAVLQGVTVNSSTARSYSQQQHCKELQSTAVLQGVTVNSSTARSYSGQQDSKELQSTAALQGVTVDSSTARSYSGQQHCKMYVLLPEFMCALKGWTRVACERWSNQTKPLIIIS